MTRTSGLLRLISIAGTGVIVLAVGCVSIEPVAPADVPTSAQTTSPISTARPSTTTASPSATSSPATTPTPRPTPTPTSKPSPTPRPTVSTEGACGDPTYNLSGYAWVEPFVWRFRESSVPSDLDPDAVLEVLQRSVGNITGARNDCGLPDKVFAYATYEGTTEEEACEEEADFEWSVIAFGEIPADAPAGTIAVTCPYGFGAFVGKADILLSTDVDWELSVDECIFGELLEATVTHEVGHVFGLGHVSERRHGDLTMSTASNGFCSEEEITLGLGDVLGLEELYPN